MGPIKGSIKTSKSFLIRGPPGSGKSTLSKDIIRVVAEQKYVYVVSFTNSSVANLTEDIPNVRYLTCDRFIRRALHRNALRTPSMILWDEGFIVLRP